MDYLDKLEQENREYCDAIASHIESLRRIKSLFMVGGIELATTEQVADFYEVPVSKILMNLTLYKDEFEADGVGAWKPDEPKTVLTLNDGTEITIPDFGLLLWPKRAICRMGMVLSGSSVAEDVRRHLLHILDATPDEQKAAEIDKEIALVYEVIDEAIAEMKDKENKGDAHE